MTIEILLMFLVIASALFFFVTEKLPVDITAFLIMIVLMILGQFLPHSFPTIAEGLSGLGNSATITVLAMFILSAGIQKTGLIHTLGKRVFALVGNSEIRQMLAIAFIVAPISGFINNTAAVAILLPMVLDLSKRSRVPATKLLIPLSFFAMLGGTLTLIGTSTTILASSFLSNSPLFAREISMFEFSKLGLIVFATGLIYFLTIGRKLLPVRENQKTDREDETLFLTEIIIEKGGIFLGKTLLESQLESRNDVLVLKIIREGKSFIKTMAEKKLEEGDILLLRASEQRIIDLIKKEGVKLLTNFDEKERRRGEHGGKIIKVMLRTGRIFQNKTLDEIGFWKRFSASVVGIDRKEISVQRLGSLPMRVGEILLVQASIGHLRKLKNTKDFLLLEEIEEEFQPEKMWLSLGIVVAVILVSAFSWLPIVISALVGVMAMVLTRCIQADEMYDSVNWEIIFLLAGVIPLGIAMEKSGTAGFIATGITSFSGFLPPIFLLMLFYLLTTLLTEIISNNAAVILILPIVLSVVGELGLNPLPFVIAVLFAASTSFLTPVGYQTNTMVYGSGNYRFFDFMRVGAPLNILLLFVTSFFIAFWWPLSS